MSLAVVDSHIHFWDPARIAYPWHSGAPAIADPHLPADLLAESRGNPDVEIDIQGIVFVEADCRADQRLDEVAWVSELAEQEPRIQAIVASAALEEGPDAVRLHLEALAREPLVRGIRRLIQGEAPGFCLQPAFVEAVQSLPDYGLRFDICIYHPQMEDAIGLVERCPDVSFVLDHFGKPGVKDGLFEPWAMHLKTLASFPNVQCKLSGLATEADHDNWTREQLRPYIDHAIETFGTERVFYGGDWPVAKLAVAYPTWISILHDATAHLGEAAQQRIFVTNAQCFYGIA